MARKNNNNNKPQIARVATKTGQGQNTRHQSAGVVYSATQNIRAKNQRPKMSEQSTQSQQRNTSPRRQKAAGIPRDASASDHDSISSITIKKMKDGGIKRGETVSRQNLSYVRQTFLRRNQKSNLRNQRDFVKRK